MPRHPNSRLPPPRQHEDPKPVNRGHPPPRRSRQQTLTNQVPAPERRRHHRRPLRRALLRACRPGPPRRRADTSLDGPTLHRYAGPDHLDGGRTRPLTDQHSTGMPICATDDGDCSVVRADVRAPSLPAPIARPQRVRCQQPPSHEARPPFVSGSCDDFASRGTSYLELAGVHRRPATQGKVP